MTGERNTNSSCY